MSIHAQTAMSYLEDVRQGRSEMAADEGYADRLHIGNGLLRGDLRLAKEEAGKIEDEENKKIIQSSCYFEEGMIYFSIAAGYARFARVSADSRKTSELYGDRCIKALQASADLHPDQATFYNLGLIHSNLDQKNEALQMFQKATEGDDVKTAIDARKEIGRIGPVSESASKPTLPIANTASSPAALSSNSSPRIASTPASKSSINVEVGGLIWGGILILIGCWLSSARAPLFGVPLMGWGAWLCYKSAQNK